MNIKNLNLLTRILITISLPILLLVMLAYQGKKNSNQQQEFAMWVAHTHEVIQKAQNVELAAIDMETGMRGFLLTGKQGFLEPYENGVLEFDDGLSELKELVSDNPEQQERLGQIKGGIVLWNKTVAKPSILLREAIFKSISVQQLGEDVARGNGKVFFDKFRAQIDTFIDREKILISERSQERQNNEVQTTQSVSSLEASYSWVVHTHEVIEKAQGMSAAAGDMETGMRGFLLTGNEVFLEPYTVGVLRFKQSVTELLFLMKDNPEQIKLLDEMQVLMNSWKLSVCEVMITMRREAGSDVPKLSKLNKLVAEGKGKVYFDEFRAQMSILISREAKLATKRGQSRALVVKNLTDNLQSFRQGTEWTDHTYGAIISGYTIIQAAVNMETGMRGYLLTGKEEFLEPYNRGRGQFFSLINELRITVADNPAQVALLGEVEQTITQWINEIVDPKLQLRRQMGVTSSMEDLALQVSDGQGKIYFDAFRAQIKTFIKIEEGLMATRQSVMLSSVVRANTVSLYGTILAIVITVVAFFFLARGITVPIKSLQEAALAIGEGDLSVKIEAKTRDEIGALAGSLVVMQDMLRNRGRDIEVQSWLNDGKNELSVIMREEDELVDLCRKLLEFIAKHINAQVGALYLYSQDELKLTASYAYKSRHNNDLIFKVGEGLVGQAALEKQLIIFNNLPEEHLDLKVNSGLGESSPTSIIAVPLLHGSQVMGVIELAVSGELARKNVAFLEQVAESVAISIDSTMSVIRTQKLLHQTQEQSERLASQQEELRVSNEEMQEQANELRESEEQLQAQQEELRVSNEELEESARSLKVQNEGFENKNNELKLIRDQLIDKQHELEKSSRYKSEFLANMSHELRTPLNSILILSRLLMEKDNEVLSDKERSFGSTINQSGEDLLELINDILDLSKVEAGHLDLVLEDVKIEDICANMQRNFETLASQKGLGFEVVRQDNCPESFVCDSQRLEQVLKNFISNAFKFTDKGAVSLTIGPAEEDLQTEEKGLIAADELMSFKVSDTGKGIPMDKMKMIFKAFRQEDGSIHRKFGGTGLGLAISKRLATLLGGDILVESIFGQGSSFNLLLPRSQSATMMESFKSNTQALLKSEIKELQQEEPCTSATSSPSKELRLLIIDADEGFNKRLRERAEKGGFNVMSVTDAQDALVLAEQLSPQVIIIDVELPQDDGWDIIKKLQGICPAAKFWVVSKCGEIVDPSIDGFYNKPLNDKEMDSSLERIRNLLSGEAALKLLIGGEALDAQLAGVARKAGFEPHVVKDCSELRSELSKAYDGLLMDLNFDGRPSVELMQQLKGEGLELPSLLVCTSQEIDERQEKALDEFNACIIMMTSSSTERLEDELQSLAGKSLKPLTKQHPKKAPKEQELAGKKILLVDDDPRNVLSLSHALESRGLVVEVAYNGVEALQQIKKHDFDMVLMDIMMPEMDGLECTRQIRLNSKLKNLPILAVTAKAMKGDRDKCLAAGVSDYITKPVELPRLMELLKIWMN